MGLRVEGGSPSSWLLEMIWTQRMNLSGATISPWSVLLLGCGLLFGSPLSGGLLDWLSTGLSVAPNYRSKRVSCRHVPYFSVKYISLALLALGLVQKGRRVTLTTTKYKWKFGTLPYFPRSLPVNFSPSPGWFHSSFLIHYLPSVLLLPLHAGNNCPSLPLCWLANGTRKRQAASPIQMYKVEASHSSRHEHFSCATLCARGQ